MTKMENVFLMLHVNRLQCYTQNTTHFEVNGSLFSVTSPQQSSNMNGTHIHTHLNNITQNIIQRTNFSHQFYL